MRNSMAPNPAVNRTCAKSRAVRLLLRSGDAARRPNGPAAVARGSGRDARPEPAAAPDNRCTTCGCSAPAGEPRGRYAAASTCSRLGGVYEKDHRLLYNLCSFTQCGGSSIPSCTTSSYRTDASAHNPDSLLASAHDPAPGLPPSPTGLSEQAV